LKRSRVTFGCRVDPKDVVEADRSHCATQLHERDGCPAAPAR
jgi:hypothetical protein